MKKKPLIILIIVAIAIVVFVYLAKTGIIKIETFGDTIKKEEITAIKSIPKIESGKVYVYHGSELEGDAEGYKEDTQGDFYECGYTSLNFEITDSYRKSQADDMRIIWVDQSDEGKIPVLDANNGDRLVYAYLSTKEILPISFERYYYGGYTIGVSGLRRDDGNHIMLPVYSAEKDAKSYINLQSDAASVVDLARQFEDGVIYLDKIGGQKVTGDNIGNGGAIKGLEKGKSYVCNFYTGTYFQDFVLTSDHLCFSGFPREFFNLYGYKFLHSNVVEIEIPEFLKSGYYFVNGLGMFRYIAKGDTADSPTDDPIILVDEDGNVLNSEVYSYGKVMETKELKETIPEKSEQQATGTVTGAVSTEPVRKYTYTVTDGTKALLTANFTGAPVNGAPAQMIVTAPDGTTTSVDEQNGSAAYQNDKQGTYQIVITNVAGREVQLVNE